MARSFRSAMIAGMDIAGLPGHDLITQGLADLAQQAETIPALLVVIGAPRLRRAGISIPSHTVTNPEIALYQKLAESDPDSAHSRYNSLIRKLVSFERAVECAASIVNSCLRTKES